jgi:hypothetical protein
MITPKLILYVLMWITIIAAVVIVLWIFPRLFLAQYSPAIRENIRRHPVLHLAWGVLACGIVYCLFLMDN